MLRIALLGAAMLLPAVASAQDQSDRRYLLLERWLWAEGEAGIPARRSLLEPSTREFVQTHANRVLADMNRCREGGDGAVEACTRGDVRRRLRIELQSVAETTSSEVYAAERRMGALETWNRIYPETARQAAGQPVERFVVWRTGDQAFLSQECNALRSAAMILGGDYSSRIPCPTIDQIVAVQRAATGRSDALARAQAAEIAANQEEDGRRDAAARAAVANSGPGLVEVRTYDANGNYTGTRMMTPSQAETVGARPQ